MSLDFSNVTQWTIPEGEVLSASLNGVTVWTQPQQHTYEPTSQNGNGLYGLVDGQYVPLTCTTNTTYSWTYKQGTSTYSVSGSYVPYISKSGSTGTTYKQYTTSLQGMTNAQWSSQSYYYFVGSGVYKTIARHSNTSYSYKDPNGNTYTGQRYIQTS